MMATIGLICAMRMEAGPLLRLAGPHRPMRIGEHRAWELVTGRHRCVLVVCGMGLEHARKAARSLIGAERPELLLSFGIAGAMGDTLGIGDIVVGERSAMWEKGRAGTVHPLARLSKAAHAAAAGAAARRGVQCLSGTILTVRGIQPLDAAFDGTAVVEMETAAIAEAAAESSTPLVSLRAVSDTPDEPIPFTVKDGQRLSPILVLGMLFRNLRRVGALLRLARNSVRAARILGDAVWAAVNHQVP